MDPIVRSLWAAHVGRGRTAERLLDELVARYGEPHRRYHGRPHLERVVADSVRLGRAESLTAEQQRAVVLAAGFHDAVYDPRSATNEADSATLAVAAAAELGWGPADAGEVGRLVLATAAHEPVDAASDPARAVLQDADLAVLAADVPGYEAYVRGVRQEYAHVDDDGWRTGRAIVLRRLLALPRRYSTRTASSWEARARANLTAELHLLEPTAP